MLSLQAIEFYISAFKRFISQIYAFNVSGLLFHATNL